MYLFLLYFDALKRHSEISRKCLHKIFLNTATVVTSMPGRRPRIYRVATSVYPYVIAGLIHVCYCVSKELWTHLRVWRALEKQKFFSAAPLASYYASRVLFKLPISSKPQLERQTLSNI